MKSIVVREFGGVDALRIENSTLPRINENEVLISSYFTSVNYADIQTRQGKYHAAGNPPIIPGLDVAGVVEKVGSNVNEFKNGDKVIAFTKNGSYSEFCVADKNLTFKKPENISFEVAAAMPLVSVTSYNLLKTVGCINKGETVLIHAAAGGIGTTAIQLAKLMGAKKVIGTVSSEDKKHVPLEVGADEVICLSKEDFVVKVKKLTNNKGVDIILDSVAGEIGSKSLGCLANYGRLINFGIASGQAVKFKSTDLHSSCRSILGFSIGTTIRERPRIISETAEEIIRLFSEGKLDMKIGGIYPFENAAEAHQVLESRRSKGKMILKIK